MTTAWDPAAATLRTALGGRTTVADVAAWRAELERARKRPHDDAKLAEYDRRLGRADQRFFADRGAAEPWRNR